MEVSQEIKDKLAISIQEYEDGTKLETFKEIKAILNTAFGEANNQIIKPSVESLVEGIRMNFVQNAEAIKYIERSSAAELMSRYSNQWRYQVIVLVPEIEITNGTRSHKLLDVYVRFFLRKDGTLTGNLEGCRGTLTEVEHNCRYVHSHLPALDVSKPDFVRFCTGVGEINMVMAKLATKFTIPNFMMFCLQIKNFLAWESKEGHPYMFLDNIFLRSNVNFTLMYNIGKDNAVKIAKELIRVMKTTLPAQEVFKFFKFEVRDVIIKLDFNEELELWIAKQLMDTDPFSPVFRLIVSNSYQVCHLLRIKDSLGTYHGVPVGTTNNAASTTPMFQFKGRDIKLKIINKKEKEDVKMYANPEISQEVCEKLSCILTGTAINNDRVRKGITIENKPETPKPDSVPVQGDLDPGMVGNALL